MTLPPLARTTLKPIRRRRWMCSLMWMGVAVCVAVGGPASGVHGATGLPTNMEAGPAIALPEPGLAPEQRHAIHLRRAVELAPDAARVTLGDVASLHGVANALADLTIADWPTNKPGVTVRLSDVAARLDEADVNRATLTLGGFLQCEVTRTSPTSSASSAGADELLQRGAPMVPAAVGGSLANPQHGIDVDQPLTLRDLVLDHLQRRLGVARDRMSVGFRSADAERLAVSLFDRSFEIEPASQGDLGRVRLTLRESREGQAPVESSLYVAVAIEREVVVARRAITRGETITQADVELSTVRIDNDRLDPAIHLSEVVGQAAMRSMQPRDVLETTSVRAPTLVRRGERMLVRARAGALMVRTEARAMEDGAQDAFILVRHDITRETFLVRVTGRREGEVVSSMSLTADARSHESAARSSRSQP